MALWENNMRLCEIVEGLTKKKTGPAVPRNFVAKNSPTSGAGAHSNKKFSRKEKHKSKNPKQFPD